MSIGGEQMAGNEDIEEKDGKESNADRLADLKVNVRILLAAFWVCHFLLWTFGDMVALLQHKNPDPIDDNLLTFAAAPLAIIQTLMIVFALIGKPKLVRLANITVTMIYVLFNIGYLAEAGDGWQYVLGIAYVFFNVLIIWTAWKWPIQEIQSQGDN